MKLQWLVFHVQALLSGVNIVDCQLETQPWALNTEVFWYFVIGPIPTMGTCSIGLH